ncbi:hypothetical protein CDEF62S_06202 [Castellaniella defragrans]
MRSVKMPLASESSGLSAVARMATPSLVRVSSRWNASIESAAAMMTAAPAGESRPPKISQGRDRGRGNARAPAPQRACTPYCMIMPRPKEAIIRMAGELPRSFAKISRSLRMPTPPATATAITAPTKIAQPGGRGRARLTARAMNAPMVPNCTCAKLANLRMS